jgi:ribonuclease M5
MKRMRILETIVVEGRHDQARLSVVVDAPMIVSDGTHVRPSTLKRLDHAYATTGLIIFCDPDSPGASLRARLSQRYPNAKHAHLTQKQARKGARLGVEHACLEDLVAALQHLSTPAQQPSHLRFSDLMDLGLSGSRHARLKRYALAQHFHLQEASAKTFWRACQRLGIERADLEAALKQTCP